jgi:hypothetical protein
VVAEVKAPWVVLYKGDPEPACTAENRFRGTVSRIVKGKVATEIVVRIDDRRGTRGHEPLVGRERPPEARDHGRGGIHGRSVVGCVQPVAPVRRVARRGQGSEPGRTLSVGGRGR